MENTASTFNSLNGCCAVSARVASCKQQKWTLNCLSRKVNCGVVHKITGKAIESGLEMGTNKGLVAARIPSQIIPQNQPSKHIVLPPHWTCDLMACIAVTLALNPGHHWWSSALLPLETQSFKLSCHCLLLQCIVFGLFFSWVTNTRFKVELRKTGSKYFCFCLSPPPLPDSQISELSKQRKGSNVGQPRKYTNYPLSKWKSRQSFSELPQQKAGLRKKMSGEGEVWCLQI